MICLILLSAANTYIISADFYLVAIFIVWIKFGVFKELFVLGKKFEIKNCPIKKLYDFSSSYKSTLRFRSLEETPFGRMMKLRLQNRELYLSTYRISKSEKIIRHQNEGRKHGIGRETNFHLQDTIGKRIFTVYSTKSFELRKLFGTQREMTHSYIYFVTNWDFLFIPLRMSNSSNIPNFIKTWY